MTETQATELIANTEEIITLLGVLQFFVEVAAISTGLTAGLVLCLCLLRGLIVKRFMT